MTNGVPKSEALNITVGPVKRGAYTATYETETGEKRIVNFRKSSSDIVNFFAKKIGNKKEIPIQEITLLKSEIESEFPKYNVDNGTIDRNSLLRHAVDDYTQDYSDAGKTISLKEIREWFEKRIVNVFQVKE